MMADVFAAVAAAVAIARATWFVRRELDARRAMRRVLEGGTR